MHTLHTHKFAFKVGFVHNLELFVFAMVAESWSLRGHRSAAASMRMLSSPTEDQGDSRLTFNMFNRISNNSLLKLIWYGSRFRIDYSWCWKYWKLKSPFSQNPGSIGKSMFCSFYPAGNVWNQIFSISLVSWKYWKSLFFYFLTSWKYSKPLVAPNPLLMKNIKIAAKAQPGIIEKQRERERDRETYIPCTDLS